jgi:16S rRNA G966 N2-methylase RsmD
MIIQLDAGGSIKLKQLLKTKVLNMDIATRLIATLTSKGRYLIQPVSHDLKTESEKLVTLMMNRIGYETDNPSFKTIRKAYFPNGIVKLNPLIYENNPYFKTIQGTNTKKGSWNLGYQTYRPYQVFAYQDVAIDPNNDYQEVTPLGYFSTKLSYLAISENNVTWMSVTPFEIETMQPAIDQMHGRVLMFGLGLGYAAFMAARKKSVTSVTIVEKDSRVVHLFKHHLLPQFPEQQKIIIVEEDAFTYLNKPEYLKSFDSAFVDLYHDATDGLNVYLKMKKIEVLSPKISVYYWLEKSILALLRRYFLILIEEQNRGAIETDYQSNLSFDDQVVNALYQTTKNITLRNEVDLISVLSDQSLADLAKKTTLMEQS